MSGKIIPVGELKAWDVFRSCGYEYVYLGHGECCNQEYMTVVPMGNLCTEVEYLGTREFHPYIPPDWRNLLIPGNIDYDRLVVNLNMAEIEWRPYPRGLFKRKVVQVKEDRYQDAQCLRDYARLFDNGPFAPGTK